ncbi:alpha/beta hydrolase [Streptomyces sp. FXJ1.172]|uniref:alpha/beta fold hydrolase n=1 Tax=Streptomyces sp. FXJ1.172 TaxID=710705 RepID=UPI0007D0316C|nr:alpha/beta hydrolase [Streptomyces sp. FXJ1.172]WEO94473.1 alpha/beta hydrolase [Streptomyces sp. FXJ1.172]
MTSSTRTVTLTPTRDRGDAGLDLTVDERGEGRPFLLLHGGGGPQTVAGFAGLLAGSRPARVITPVHPGFGGTARPDRLTGVRALAEVYVRLLDELGLDGVTVVGNSIGGWIAAEIALLHSERVSGVVLVNAVGIHVPGHPVADPATLTPAELSALAFHDPAKFAVDPSTFSEAQRAVAAADRAALQVYAGPDTMSDPTLRERLAKVTHQVLVAWGESDRVVDTAYGRAYAAAVPGARFELLRRTGHMPQIETPEQLLPVVWDFAASQAVDRPNG